MSDLERSQLEVSDEDLHILINTLPFLTPSFQDKLGKEFASRPDVDQLRAKGILKEGE